VISRATFDLPNVLNTLVESAAGLCEADAGAIFRPTGNDSSYYLAASYRHTPEYLEHMKTLTFAPGRGAVAECCWRANPFKLRMFWPIRNLLTLKPQGSATFAPSSVFRFYAGGYL